MKASRLLPLLFLFFSSAAFAQYSATSNQEAIFQKFLKTKKLVVELSGNAEYDSALTAAVTKYWKLNPIEFVSPEKMDGKMRNETSALLMPINIQQTTIVTSDRTSASRPNDQLALMVGNINVQFNDYDMIAFSVFDPDMGFIGKFNYKEDIGKSLMAITFRLNDVIATLCETVELIRKDDGKFRNDPIEGVKYMNNKFYNPRITVLKTKTLYINANDIKHAERVAGVYPYKFKVVSDEEYKKVVKAGGKDVVYMVVNYSLWGGISLIDAEEHKCVGGIFYGLTPAIDERDMGALTKLIEKVEKGKK